MKPDKQIKIPKLKFKRFEPKGYTEKIITKNGVEIRLTKKARERIKKRLGLVD